MEAPKLIHPYMVNDDGYVFVATEHMLGEHNLRPMSEAQYHETQQYKDTLPKEPEEVVVAAVVEVNAEEVEAPFKPKISNKTNLIAKIKEESGFELDPDDYTQKQLVEHYNNLMAEKEADASDNSDNTVSE